MPLRLRGENLFTILNLSCRRVAVRIRLNLGSVVLRIAIENEFMELTSLGLSLNPYSAIGILHNAELTVLICPNAEILRNHIGKRVAVRVGILNLNRLSIRSLVVLNFNGCRSDTGRSIAVLVRLDSGEINTGSLMSRLINLYRRRCRNNRFLRLLFVCARCKHNQHCKHCKNLKSFHCFEILKVDNYVNSIIL